MHTVKTKQKYISKVILIYYYYLANLIYLLNIHIWQPICIINVCTVKYQIKKKTSFLWSDQGY